MSEAVNTMNHFLKRTHTPVPHSNKQKLEVLDRMRGIGLITSEEHISMAKEIDNDLYLLLLDGRRHKLSKGLEN